ncbi:hypothetical protein HAV15_006467 [Penicillium sp. str. |nr:hypothetical protein HAV15_006467 [Penicillium sp. str. \
MPLLFNSLLKRLFTPLFKRLFLGSSWHVFFVPVPIHPRGKDDSALVELLHVATEKGPLLALEVGGVALLYLLLKQAGLFVVWLVKFHIERRASMNDNAGEPVRRAAAARPVGRPEL